MKSWSVVQRTQMTPKTREVSRRQVDENVECAEVDDRLIVVVESTGSGHQLASAHAVKHAEQFARMFGLGKVEQRGSTLFAATKLDWRTALTRSA